MLELLAPQALGVLRVFLQQTFVGVACHVRVFEQALHLLYALCGFFVGLFGQFAALEHTEHALEVQMATWADVSSCLLCRCWTKYSTPHL